MQKIVFMFTLSIVIEKKIKNYNRKLIFTIKYLLSHNKYTIFVLLPYNYRL